MRARVSRAYIHRCFRVAMLMRERLDRRRPTAILGRTSSSRNVEIRVPIALKSKMFRPDGHGKQTRFTLSLSFRRNLTTSLRAKKGEVLL